VNLILQRKIFTPKDPIATCHTSEEQATTKDQRSAVKQVFHHPVSPLIHNRPVNILNQSAQSPTFHNFPKKKG
jgi:hypothetical protein